MSRRDGVAVAPDRASDAGYASAAGGPSEADTGQSAYRLPGVWTDAGVSVSPDLGARVAASDAGGRCKRLPLGICMDGVQIDIEVSTAT